MATGAGALGIFILFDARYHAFLFYYHVLNILILWKFEMLCECEFVYVVVCRKLEASMKCESKNAKQSIAAVVKTDSIDNGTAALLGNELLPKFVRLGDRSLCEGTVHALPIEAVLVNLRRLVVT